MEGHHALFSFSFTQTAPAAGPYSTITFNSGTAGGLAQHIDFRNLDTSDTAVVNIDGLGLVATADIVSASAGIGSHELGHLLGLRHGDCFGPIGQGIHAPGSSRSPASKEDRRGDAAIANWRLVSRAVPGDYLPPYPGPTTATEATDHIMASPASVGSTGADLLTPSSFSERSAVKLAFNETPNATTETAVSGISLPFATLTVPNTVLPSHTNDGKDLEADVISVAGSLSVGGEVDTYDFMASAGDVFQLEVISNAIRHRILNTIDPIIEVTDAGGTLIDYYGTTASNDDEFENSDSILIDLVIPADDLYRIRVRAFLAADTGGYELFAYRFRAITETDLSITKDDGVASGVPGAQLTYTLTVTNNGPADSTGSTVTDVLPAALSFVSSADCSEAGGTVTCAIGALVAGASQVVSFVVAIDSAHTASILNAASVAANETDPTPGNDSASHTTPLTPEADVSITKTDGVTSAIPGQSLTYSIVASNAGPSDDPGVVISDAFPADLSCTWTCTPSGSAACTAGPVAGDLADVAGLPVGTSATYTAVCAIDPAATGTLSNTATATASVSDPVAGNNSATDSDTLLAPQTDLSASKSDGLTTANPGDPITYTIQVAASGPSDAPGSAVMDVFPAGLTGVIWTCTASPGSSCAAAGAGNINESVDLAAGGTVTFTTTGSVSAVLVGVLSNTVDAQTAAGVTDVDPSNNGATDTTTVSSPADISGSLTVGGDFQVGGLVTYSATLFNSNATAQLDNPSDEFSDFLPPELTLLSASASAGTTSLDLGANSMVWNGTIPGGGMVEITIEATINSGAGSTTIVNQGTIYFDADGNGTNESVALTDDPSAGGVEDPTTFAVLAIIEIPALGPLGLGLLAVLLPAMAVFLLRRRRNEILR